MLRRRSLLSAATLAAAAAPVPLARPALAQGAAGGAWPDRPVRVLVPWPPGGSTDVLTRLMCEQLSQRLGQPFVVENRPGASGNIGMDAIAKAAPDGYTLGPATIANLSINQFAYRNMNHDPERDLLPVALTWEMPNVAVVSPQHVPVQDLQGFVAWAKAKRGGITYGSPGVTTTAHLSGALLSQRAGFEASHVPYRGAAQVIPTLLSGDLNFAIDNLASYLPVIQEGRLRGLAVTSAERWPTLPTVPTMAEAGVPDFVVTSWCTLAFPAGVPRPVVDRLNAAIRQVAADPAVQQRFQQVGAKVLWSTPEDAAAHAAKQRPLWRDLVQLTGARIE
jgi:tripartite-type tricarboxylate transporter receptor subunit TctC